MENTEETRTSRFAVTVDEALTRLLEPFSPSDLEWLPEFNKKKIEAAKDGDEIKVRVMTYITARAVQTRLDMVLGPHNWSEDYKVITVGNKTGVSCILRIRYPETGEWVEKVGWAEPSDFESVKGGESNALKRCAVKLGIGRYLYSFPDHWCRAVKKGGGLQLLERPAVPVWAYPADYRGEPETGMIPVRRFDDSADFNAPTETGLTPTGAAVKSIERPSVEKMASSKPAAQSKAPEKKVAAPTAPAPAEKLVEKKVEAATAAQAAEKPSEKTAAPAAKDDVSANLDRARAYRVPKRKDPLPGEGRTLGEVLDEKRTVGIHLLKILVNHDSLKALNLKPFVPDGEDETKLVAAAKYLLDHYIAELKKEQAK